MTRYYLDHNATSNLLPEVQKRISAAISKPLNPSSVHFEGREAKSRINHARYEIATLFNINLNTKSHHVLFTSSGTEANNIVFASNSDKKIIISAVEHSSVIEAAKHYGKDVEILPVNEHGIVILEKLEQILQHADKPCLVSIIAANNETGVLQPLDQILTLTQKYNAKLHSDCVQIPGKLLLDLSALDYISISAHKCGGLSGVGALIYKDTNQITPIIFGGGQEQSIRAGTENVMGIVSLGAAAAWCTNHCLERIEFITNLQTHLEHKILSANLGAKVFGLHSPHGRLCNTSMILMPNIEAQRQIIMFDLAGFAVSSGAACSSGKIGQSHVLKAMGVNDDEINCTIRISLSHTNTEHDIEKFVTTWIDIANNNHKINKDNE